MHFLGGCNLGVRIDKEKVKKLYLKEGLKAPEIAKKLNKEVTEIWYLE